MTGMAARILFTPVLRGGPVYGAGGIFTMALLQALALLALPLSTTPVPVPVSTTLQCKEFQSEAKKKGRQSLNHV
jgi:hypothetical protein